MLKHLIRIQKTWIKLCIYLVYFILWFKIIDMENLCHEWLHYMTSRASFNFFIY